MAKYIDRDAFLAHERAWYCDNCGRRKNSKGKTVYEIGEAPCRACSIGDILDLLEDYPTADVVEVVRCKDCVHGEVDDTDFPFQYLCHYHGDDWNDKDHYCSNGIKR